MGKKKAKKLKRCSACGGGGAITAAGGRVVPCPKCDGSGKEPGER